MTKSFCFILQNEVIPNKIIKELGLTRPICYQTLTFDMSSKLHNELVSQLFNDKEFPSYNDINVKSRSLSCWYSYFHESSMDIKKKYSILADHIYSPFLIKTYVPYYIDVFYHVQKVYFGFTKLARIYRLKHAKLQVEMDMLMTPITEGQKNIFVYIEKSNKYLFSLTDIINLFTMSLLNTSFMIATPNYVKNPYTNTNFQKHTLYNMYFFMKKQLIKIPIYIEAFYSCDFRINLFSCKFKSIIQEFAIENYITNAPKNEIVGDMSYMLHDYSMTHDINIHPRFPKDDLIIVMKPYLKLYHKSKYSLSQGDNKYYRNMWIQFMETFFNETPDFGKLYSVSFSLSEHIPLFNEHNYNSKYNFNMKHKLFREIKDIVEQKRLINDPRITNMTIGRQYPRQNNNFIIENESSSDEESMEESTEESIQNNVARI